MLFETRTITTNVLIAILFAVMAVACSDIDPEFNPYPDSGKIESTPARRPNQTPRSVFIYMGLGYNNLSSYLSDDIDEIIANKLPTAYWQDDVVLIFSHKTAAYSDYSTPTSPTLTRIYTDWDGSVAKDTLMRLDDTTISASAKTINSVLSYVKEEFPATSYGMMMSSHGTGWVPADYCNDPSDYDAEDNDIWFSQRRRGRTPKPFLDDLSIDGAPAVKSFGVQNISKSELKEIDITDLADAIPMKMDYIIFDACFMGGVEVAFEFKDKCNLMAFSQTEILADGMDYQSILSYILDNNGPDLKGFCENYFLMYDNRSGFNRSATISLVDCRRLTPLADVCREIFDSRREGIAELENSSDIQRFYRSSYADCHKWFFDLYDIAKKCGASEVQLDSLNDALKGCIIYKAATDVFIDLKIYTHCGLSMYLPYQDRTYLNNFYKTLEWNKATGLVQ